MFNIFVGIIDWFKSFFSKSTTDQVLEIQARAKQICSFLPTANSVLAILTVPNPSVVGVEAIAAAICQVVNASAPGTEVQLKGLATAWPGTVNGVVVEGERVQ